MNTYQNTWGFIEDINSLIKVTVKTTKMITSKYNLNHLVKIITQDTKISNSYIYLKEIKFLGICFRRKGIYSTNNYRGKKYYQKNGLDENKYYLNKKNQVMVKPNVTLIFINEYYNTDYFETLYEANRFKYMIILRTNSNSTEWVDGY